jgi:hypothetical protein
VNVTAGFVALTCYEYFTELDGDGELTKLGFNKQSLGRFAHDMLKPFYSPTAKAALNNRSINTTRDGLLPRMRSLESYLISQGVKFDQ